MKRDIDHRRLQGYTNSSIKCKVCGHTILPTRDRGICSHCGYWVYRNKRIEFRYKVYEKMKKRGK